MKQHDLLIGRHPNGDYIYLQGGEPIAVTARTGSGKSADVVIPLCFTYPGSLVVLDIKGTAFKATAGHRAVALGQDVYLFEPASRSGRSHRWDPFASVSRNAMERFRQIARMGSLKFPEIDQIGGGSNHNKFWTDAGRQAFRAVATILAETPTQRLSMDHITRIFTRADGHEWLSDLIEGRRGSDRPYSQIAVDGISDYIGSDDKLRGDIRKTVSTALQVWSDPQLTAVTSGADFDLSDIRRKPMTIYVVIAPRDMEWLRPLLRLFFDQLIQSNTDTVTDDDPNLKHQTLILLDEFVRLGRIDSLAHAAQYSRDYGLRMAYIMQNKAQLRNIYGPDGCADLFGNLGAEIIFGTNDPQVTKEVEERLGDNTVMFTTRNKPRFMSWANLSKHGESDHPHRRPLMYDQEFAVMNSRKQLIFRSGMPPMLTNRNRWFENPEFVALVRPPSPVPKLDISIAYDDGRVRVRPMSPAGNITTLATT